MRLDARTRAAEVLEAWARALKLPFIGALREAQAYVRCVEQGLTVFDLPEAQAQADVAQWKSIVAWLAPVLQAVRRPVLHGNASVVRAAPESARLVEIAGDEAACDGAASAGGLVVARPALTIEAPTAPVALAARVPAREIAGPAPAQRLGSLFGWLTAPRFLHRNT